MMTMSSVTVVLPQPPEPVLESLTVLLPLAEVGVKLFAVRVALVFKVPVPLPPPKRLHDQVPGVEADAPVNVTVPVPHWFTVAGPASTVGVETQFITITSAGLVPAQVPLPVAVKVMVICPVAELGVIVGVKPVVPVTEVTVPELTT